MTGFCSITTLMSQELAMSTMFCIYSGETQRQAHSKSMLCIMCSRM